ncbi:hypothetical protein G7Z17_g10368 [Cylindrodendrum hubeiense]|uniref:Uncharacterized protein n=1 Tax=Cylindrodendrum hubeiense TaxID=595255 RepID=A0A9P5GYV3_9HYPO|nr:hypothetical protein G7Z17_g10368 [Cylindrodendrum hubeiense]
MGPAPQGPKRWVPHASKIRRLVSDGPGFAAMAGHHLPPHHAPACEVVIMQVPASRGGYRGLLSMDCWSWVFSQALLVLAAACPTPDPVADKATWVWDAPGHHHPSCCGVALTIIMESPAEDESPESAAPPPEDPYRSERPGRARVQPLPKAAASLDLRVPLEQPPLASTRNPLIHHFEGPRSKVLFRAHSLADVIQHRQTEMGLQPAFVRRVNIVALDGV